MQKTQWYDNRQVKPVRTGVYEVEWSGPMGGIWFNFWDGKRWHYGSRDKVFAGNNRSDPVEPVYRRLAIQWRGVMRANGGGQRGDD